jgi:hypothetical protein
VPSYGATDTFELDGQPLVYQDTVGGEAVYKTQRESFLDVRFNVSGGYWKVSRNDGRQLYFGQSPASRVGISSVVFEWMLTCEEDALGTPCISGAGNAIRYRYFKDVPNFVVYLQEVEYGQQPTRVVRFELESAERPDQPLSFLSGLPQKLTRRLDHITVQTVTGPATGNDIIRRYDLQYTAGGNGLSLDSSRSLLRAVTLQGVGGAGGLERRNGDLLVLREDPRLPANGTRGRLRGRRGVGNPHDVRLYDRIPERFGERAHGRAPRRAARPGERVPAARLMAARRGRSRTTC